MLCIVCQSKPAIKHPSLGYLSCLTCRTTNKKPTLPYEFQLDSVKQSRREYDKDILQSSRDGVLSQERLDTYGTRGLKVTPEQVKNARYVWNDRESISYKKGNPKLI